MDEAAEVREMTARLRRASGGTTQLDEAVSLARQAIDRLCEAQRARVRTPHGRALLAERDRELQEVGYVIREEPDMDDLLKG